MLWRPHMPQNTKEGEQGQLPCLSVQVGALGMLCLRPQCCLYAYLLGAWPVCPPPCGNTKDNTKHKPSPALSNSCVTLRWCALVFCPRPWC